MQIGARPSPEDGGRGRTSLDPDGRFDVTVPWAPEQRAELWSPDFSIRVEAELAPELGETRWSLELETATLAGRLDEEAVFGEMTSHGPSRGKLLHRAELGAVQARTTLRVDGGAIRPQRVFAGPTTLCTMSYSYFGSDEQPIGELHLAPGEERSIELF